MGGFWRNDKINILNVGPRSAGIQSSVVKYRYDQKLLGGLGRYLTSYENVVLLCYSLVLIKTGSGCFNSFSKWQQAQGFRRKTKWLVLTEQSKTGSRAVTVKDIKTSANSQAAFILKMFLRAKETFLQRFSHNSMLLLFSHHIWLFTS